MTKYLRYLSLFLLPLQLNAQTPAWVLATTGTTSRTGLGGYAEDVAVDAAGNVFIIGEFTNTITFGTTTLTSAGSTDIFVAKYVPGTGTWAWASRAGGAGAETGAAITVNGTSVYITGTVTNNLANTNAVTFNSSPQYGAAAGAVNADIFVAKYTDAGTSSTLNWSQVAGGTGYDYSTSIAASGGNVFVTGTISNNRANLGAVVLGGTGTAAGTVPQYGASATYSGDLLLIKYLDQGNTADVAWTQVAGGTAADYGTHVAVSGSSVYVTGVLYNDRANGRAVLVGGTGTTAGTRSQYGASSQASDDLLLIKYLDQGSTAAVAWSQVAGGVGSDQANGVAVDGSNVYITGYFINNLGNTNAVLFGGAGTAAGSVTVRGTATALSTNAILAKYTDNGTAATVGWTQVAGGGNTVLGYDVVASGNKVYMSGFLYNNTANANNLFFGGNGTTPGTVPRPGASATVSSDIVLAGYTDLGSSATLDWTQIGGGTDNDYVYGLALSGTRLYTCGIATAPASFPPLVFSASTTTYTNLVAAIDLATPLATNSETLALVPHLFPNPTTNIATLSGATPGGVVEVLDALGRVVAKAIVQANGQAMLDLHLPAGVYAVRCGKQTLRLSVE